VPGDIPAWNTHAACGIAYLAVICIVLYPLIALTFKSLEAGVMCFVWFTGKP